jgi:hypothetical protein
MYLLLIISIVVAFLLSILILKLLAKTFKFLVFMVIFVIAFGIIYFGYDTVAGRFSLLSSPSVEVPPVQSSTGCSADSDCAFVVSGADCSLVANSCNNIRDSSNFFKPDTKIKCSIDSVVLSPDIACSCKKASSGSYCGKL